MAIASIQTVTGPIAADALGRTLAHEHIWCDLTGHSGREDNRVTDAARSISELAHFRSAGGGTIIELTPEGIGRNPAKLREISLGSGVPIICGIAFYDRSTVPAWVHDAPESRVTEYFVHALTDGTDGVRAGIIGEITSHNEPEPNMRGYQLDAVEKKLFRAAAQAHRLTGAGITTHASLGRAGHAQLDVLESAGADLRRVCIGHCDTHLHDNPDDDLAYYLPILQRGAFVEFDLIGWTELGTDDIRADRIAALVEMGYETQITMATDTCRQSHLKAGGGHGYDFLFRDFLPRLRARGVTEKSLDAMLITAPRNLLIGSSAL